MKGRNHGEKHPEENVAYESQTENNSRIHILIQYNQTETQTPQCHAATGRKECRVTQPQDETATADSSRPDSPHSVESKVRTSESQDMALGSQGLPFGNWEKVLCQWRESLPEKVGRSGVNAGVSV